MDVVLVVVVVVVTVDVSVDFAVVSVSVGESVDVNTASNPIPRTLFSLVSRMYISFLQHGTFSVSKKGVCVQFRFRCALTCDKIRKAMQWLWSKKGVLSHPEETISLSMFKFPQNSLILGDKSVGPS